MQSVGFSLVICILGLQDVENRGNKMVWSLQGLNRAACETFVTITVRWPDESIDCLWCTKSVAYLLNFSAKFSTK